MWKLAGWLIDKLEPFMQLLEQLGWKETLKNWFKKASSWVVEIV